jgi:two-component system, cell cycle sensor histidine kinase and response regulator CckA
VRDVGERQAGRILIVDDEKALLVVMEQYLRRLGYEVAACLSGQEAWDLFEAHPSAYSLVLADITMPEMSGQELLRRMLQLNPAICILICSGYPFDVATLPAAVHHQVGFLQKPFTPKMLAGSIEQLLATRNGAAPE